MHAAPARGIFFVATVVLSLGVHAIVVGWALAMFPRLRPYRRSLIAAVVILMLIGPLSRWASLARHSETALGLHAFALTEMLVAGLAAIPIGILLAARRLASRPAAPTSGAPPSGIGRREVLGRTVGLGALGSATLAAGWGMLRSRHAFEIDEVIVRIPRLPRALEGYTIAQISDIHAGLFVGDRELGEGLSRVREVGADLLVVTGDLIDLDPSHGPRLARALADVAPRDGVVGILGNHDYYAGAERVVGAMRAAGVEMLVNAGKTIRPQDGGGFALLGVDDLWAQRAGGAGPMLERAIAMVPADRPRILLAHQPNFLDMASGRVALQLSGHMHGGQVNPGVHIVSLFARYVAGRYERAGTTLWVNRGFGVVGVPLRLEAPPEVTKIVLVGA